MSEERVMDLYIDPTTVNAVQPIVPQGSQFGLPELIDLNNTAIFTRNKRFDVLEDIETVLSVLKECANAQIVEINKND
jgi:hypothetical protein